MTEVGEEGQTKLDRQRPSKNKQEVGRLYNWWCRLRGRLYRYADTEEQSWELEEASRYNLFLTLRIRYETSKQAASRDARWGLVFKI